MNTVSEYGFRRGETIDSGALVGIGGREQAIRDAYLDSGAAHYGWQVVIRQLEHKGPGYRWEASGDWEPDSTVQVTAALHLARKALTLADQAADILTQDGWEADAHGEREVHEARSLQVEAIRLRTTVAVIEDKARAAQGL